MELLSGGEMIMRALKEEGVKMIFGYPGGAVLHIYDALYQQDSVEHILVRHEQAAVHAADGFSRSTGEVGVALVTSGPGATNAITGIATAYMDSIPLVIISGNVPSHLIGSDAFQETDMIGCSRPIVKHSFLVRSIEEIPGVMKKAFHIAKSGRPGPVVVDVPKDMTAPQEKRPFQYPEKLIPLTIINAIKTKKIPVYGDGHQVRDWLHVNDHVNALLKISKKGHIGTNYVIGGDNQISNLEIIQKVCFIIDELKPTKLKNNRFENLVNFVKDRPGHDRRYAIDFSKLSSEVGWSPQIPFDKGLLNTVNWYLSNQSWWEKVINDI